MTNRARGQCLPAIVVYAAMMLGVTARGEVRAGEGYGNIEGQFVLDGNAPVPEILVTAGDHAVKDHRVCAARAISSEALVVNPDTKGIANIFVYLREKPEPVHPTLRRSPKKSIAFIQKDCRFIPHALVVRTDQTVLAQSEDPVPHNVHVHPLANYDSPYLPSPDDRQGVPYSFPRPERFPIRVTCDLHPHMEAYWLIIDHPYAAMTDADGRFRIEKIPAGEHVFVVWHEVTGYLLKEYQVAVVSGRTTKLTPVKVPVSKFKMK